MTLDEAIRHCCAKSTSDTECGREHAQLAEWLVELKELEADDAKLRELVRDMWRHSYCSIAKTREDDDRHIEDVIDRMRKLGVEVDG